MMSCVRIAQFYFIDQTIPHAMLCTQMARLSQFTDGLFEATEILGSAPNRTVYLRLYSLIHSVPVISEA